MNQDLRSTKVMLVAPPLVSWGLERLVQSAHPRFELLDTAATLDEALLMVKNAQPDVILLDMEGAESVAALAELHSRTPARVLLLTASRDVAMLDRAVIGGLRGVIAPSAPPPMLLRALEKIHEGELWIDRQATRRIFMEMVRLKAAEHFDPDDPERSKIATLTVRERQTVAAVSGDASVPSKVIASRLCISEHTLRNHLTSIYSKLDVSTRLDLYVYAAKHGLNKPVPSARGRAST